MKWELTESICSNKYFFLNNYCKNTNNNRIIEASSWKTFKFFIWIFRFKFKSDDISRLLEQMLFFIKINFSTVNNIGNMNEWYHYFATFTLKVFVWQYIHRISVLSIYILFIVNKTEENALLPLPFYASS